MTTLLERPATADRLFLWVMHRFAEIFEEHAIIKGGMAFRLLDSPRATTDLDYVFVPYSSKKDVRGQVETALKELEDADVRITLHSQMLRAEVRLDAAAIQIEVNVALACPSTPIATGHLAAAQGQPSRVVRMMSLDVALAHKLGAWNERRLLRDLYDCYFLGARLGEQPNLEVLDQRLAQVRSRLPKLKRTKRMSRKDLVTALADAAAAITQQSVNQELAPLLPPAELAGVVPRMRAALARICDSLTQASTA